MVGIRGALEGPQCVWMSNETNDGFAVRHVASCRPGRGQLIIESSQETVKLDRPAEHLAVVGELEAEAGLPPPPRAVDDGSGRRTRLARTIPACKDDPRLARTIPAQLDASC